MGNFSLQESSPELLTFEMWKHLWSMPVLQVCLWYTLINLTQFLQHVDKGPFTYMRCDDAEIDIFLDAMNRRDWVFILHAIKPFLANYQIWMCVVKLETCLMRAIIAAIVASRAATRQCEYIIKVLIFLLVALQHCSTHHSLCERN